jgi:hypothetical protein
MGTDYTLGLVERSLAGDRAAFEQLIADLVEPGYEAQLGCGGDALTQPVADS